MTVLHCCAVQGAHTGSLGSTPATPSEEILAFPSQWVRTFTFSSREATPCGVSGGHLGSNNKAQPESNPTYFIIGLATWRNHTTRSQWCRECKHMLLRLMIKNQFELWREASSTITPLSDHHSEYLCFTTGNILLFITLAKTTQ